MVKETKDEMRETIKLYGIDEIIDQYIMDAEAGDLIKEEITFLNAYKKKANENIQNLMSTIEHQQKELDGWRKEFMF